MSQSNPKHTTRSHQFMFENFVISVYNHIWTIVTSPHAAVFFPCQKIDFAEVGAAYDTKCKFSARNWQWISFPFLQHFVGSLDEMTNVGLSWA